MTPKQSRQATRRGLVSAAVVAVASVMAAAGAAAGMAAPPVNTSPPAISGSPYVGRTLTASAGVWQNSPTKFAFQWARCDAKGNGCVQIGGATSKTYVAASADVNHSLEVLVTASNAAGTSTPVSSKPTVVITPATPPKNTIAPSVVGKPLVGEALFANPGKYSGGSVTSFAYQWQRCAAAKLTCTDISGASGQEYDVVKADVGERLRVQVIARNPFGSVTTPSEPTHPVTVPAVTVTTTITASARTTTCCRTVRLRGTVSPVRSGEAITVFAREFGDIAAFPIGSTVTDAGGNWSMGVTPFIQTTYIAQTSTSKSAPFVLSVHPRVGVRVTRKTVSADVTAGDSFAGRVVYLQQRTRTGWRRVALAVINQNSVAKFHLRLRRGHTYTLRIYLAAAQAGPGYLAGVSPTRRVRGTS